MFTGMPPVESHIKSRRVKLLAFTSKQRLASLPQIPAVNETLGGYESFAWIGLYAPAKADAVVVQPLNAAWRKARQEPEVAALMERDGMNYVNSGSPEEFVAFQRAEVGRWSKIIAQAGVMPE